LEVSQTTRVLPIAGAPIQLPRRDPSGRVALGVKAASRISDGEILRLAAQ
jgi:hypothetical protein